MISKIQCLRSPSECIAVNRRNASHSERHGRIKEVRPVKMVYPNAGTNCISPRHHPNFRGKHIQRNRD